MVREWIVRDLHWWWACHACGERIDAVVLRNRAEQAMQSAWERESLVERVRLELDALFARG